MCRDRNSVCAYPPLAYAPSLVFTIVVGFAVFFIGHGQSLARDYFLHGTFSTTVQKFITVTLAILFPDLQLFNLTDGVVSGEPVPGELLLKITAVAALYLVIYNVVAFLVFSDKEL